MLLLIAVISTKIQFECFCFFLVFHNLRTFPHTRHDALYLCIYCNVIRKSLTKSELIPLLAISRVTPILKVVLQYDPNALYDLIKHSVFTQIYNKQTCISHFHYLLKWSDVQNYAKILHFLLLFYGQDTRTLTQCVYLLQYLKQLYLHVVFS